MYLLCMLVGTNLLHMLEVSRCVTICFPSQNVSPNVNSHIHLAQLSGHNHCHYTPYLKTAQTGYQVHCDISVF